MRKHHDIKIQDSYHPRPARWSDIFQLRLFLFLSLETLRIVSCVDKLGNKSRVREGRRGRRRGRKGRLNDLLTGFYISAHSSDSDLRGSKAMVDEDRKLPRI